MLVQLLTEHIGVLKTTTFTAAAEPEQETRTWVVKNVHTTWFTQNNVKNVMLVF